MLTGDVIGDGAFDDPIILNDDILGLLPDLRLKPLVFLKFGIFIFLN
tara:strand:- start:594 stop:734 length:141 start_codon:yes stop_codon:yes gene_type:complete